MTLPVIRRLFIATILVQSFHMIEHVLQVMQISLDITPAHGLIGAFDLEWVHFFYNTAYFALLLTLFLGLGLQRVLPSHIPFRIPIFSSFLFLTIVQGYHVVEHIVKLQQHLITGLQGTSGILGSHLDLVWFHFFLNLSVYLPLLLALYGLRRVLFRPRTEPACIASPCPWMLPT